MTDGAKDGMSNESANEQGKAQNESGEDVAGLKSALQAERDARKTLDKQSKDLQAQLDKLTNAGKSETEKLAAERDKLAKDFESLNAKVRERDARDSVRDAAKKAGAPDPDIVYRFLRSDLEYGDDGEVTNLSAAIADAKQVAPQLFKPVIGKGDAGNGQAAKPGNTSMNDWIRQEAGHR